MPAAVQQQATTELADGVPFLSTTQLEHALTGAGVTSTTAYAIIDVNAEARLDALRVAFAVTALLAIAALFATGQLRRTAVGSRERQVQPPGPAPEA